MVKTMFEYNAGTKPENGIRISPSGVNTLLTNGAKWYQENVLGIDKFSGNDATVLGSIVHAYIENFYTNEHTHEHVKEKAQEYMELNRIANQMEMSAKANDMFEAWKRDYSLSYPMPTMLEKWLEFKASDRIVVSGTLDAYSEDTGVIIDWKTTSKKPHGMSQSHKEQLYMYAFLLKQNGYEPKLARVCYLQYLKTGSKVHVFDEEIIQSELDRLIDEVRDKAKLVLRAKDDNVSVDEFLTVMKIDNPFKAK